MTTTRRVSCSDGRALKKGKGKASPYSTAERRVPELIPVLGSQPARDVSHKPGCQYFPPGPQLPSQPLRGLLPVSLLGEHGIIVSRRSMVVSWRQVSKVSSKVTAHSSLQQASPLRELTWDHTVLSATRQR